MNFKQLMFRYRKRICDDDLLKIYEMIENEINRREKNDKQSK